MDDILSDWDDEDDKNDNVKPKPKVEVEDGHWYAISNPWHIF